MGAEAQAGPTGAAGAHAVAAGCGCCATRRDRVHGRDLPGSEVEDPGVYARRRSGRYGRESNLEFVSSEPIYSAEQPQCRVSWGRDPFFVSWGSHRWTMAYSADIWNGPLSLPPCDEWSLRRLARVPGARLRPAETQHVRHAHIRPAIREVPRRVQGTSPRTRARTRRRKEAGHPRLGSRGGA